MKIYNFIVKEQKIKPENPMAILPNIVAGTKGKHQVSILFIDWDNLEIWICFKGKEEYKRLYTGKPVEIPWEVMAEPGKVKVGALGLRDGQTVQPTIWANLANIVEGVTTDGEPPKPPTPSEIEQLTQIAFDAKEIAESVRQDADNGQFNGKDGQDGKNGADGKDGQDGYTPQKGVDYFDGKDGYTPIKGTDYFTDADKMEMVQDVLDALPVYNGEVETV